MIYKDEILKTISEEFPKTDKDATEIIVFGSVARNDFSPLSDIDLLILTNNPQKTRKLFSEFTKKIYLKTGVITSTKYLKPNLFVNSADPLFQIIKTEGKILWKKA